MSLMNITTLLRTLLAILEYTMLLQNIHMFICSLVINWQLLTGQNVFWQLLTIISDFKSHYLTPLPVSPPPPSNSYLIIAIIAKYIPTY